MREIRTNCIWMTVLACCSGVGSFLQRYMFGILGNNVTRKIREELYNKIMQKNIGWFHQRGDDFSEIASLMGVSVHIA